MGSPEKHNENIRIVTVQDISCAGQCSLTVALPILSSFGIETVILPSAVMSNHTGTFRGFTCLDLTDEMPKIVAQWKKEGLLFDAIYTGYIGNAAQFDTILSLKDLLKAQGKLIVDPAMADHGKRYKALDERIEEGMRKLVKEADVILPNLTEAALLLNRPYRENYTESEIREMLAALTALGPETAIITGVSFCEKEIGAAAYSRITGEYTSAMAKRMPKSYHGTGDIFASCLTAGLLNKKNLQESLQTACDFVAESIAYTLKDPSHTYGVKFEQTLCNR